MENFVFGLIGKEDINQGNGTFAATLPDGSSVTLNKVGIQTFIGSAYVSALDSAGADAGARISAAYATMLAVSTGGGTVDARGFYGDQAITTVINLTAPVNILLGDAIYTSSSLGQFVFADGVTDIIIEGGGGGTQPQTGGTVMNHTSANYLFECAGSSVAARVQLRNLKIATTSTSSSAGAIRVGRLTTTFDEALYRNDWTFENISIIGPGAANAGTIGVLLCQLGRLNSTNFLCQGYESAGIVASTTICKWQGVTTFAAALIPFKTTQVTGHPAGGQSNDVYDLLNILGPTVGSAGTGTGLYIDSLSNHFKTIFIEINTPALTAKNAIEFTANGVLNDLDNVRLAYTNGTTTKSILFAAGASRNRFDGIHGSGTIPAISMGDPSGAGGSVQNRFYDADSTIIAALSTVNATYYTAIGPDPSGSGAAVSGALNVGGALAVAGALAVTGTVTIGGGTPITKRLRFDKTAAVNILAGATAVIGPFTCTGALLGAQVTVTEYNAGGVAATLQLTPVITANDTVAIRAVNPTGLAYAPGTQTFAIDIWY